MTPLQWLIGLYIFFMMISLLLIVFVFPYRKLVWNRWKLRIGNMRGKAANPALIIFPDKSVTEEIIDTSKSTFTHLGSTYNIRPNKFHLLYGFQYLIYLHDNPEPQDLHLDDKGVIILKNEEGKVIQIPVIDVFKQPNGQYIAGRVIDGTTYDNLLVRAYNAGLAWMARNSNLVNILLWVLLGLSVLGIGVSYFTAANSQKACISAIQNISINAGRIL